MKYTEEDYYPEDDSSVYEDALCYQPTRQHHLQEIADYLQPSPRDVFVDLGCGKGRMICFMARYRLKKIIGVELRPELAEIARRTVEALAPVTPVIVCQEDAATFETDEGTIYYLFNPFGAATVREVIINIRESLTLNPRAVRIVYNNIVHAQLLDTEPWLRREGEISSTGIWVWKNSLPDRG
jgi:precorrin-6B methylase 2